MDYERPQFFRFMKYAAEADRDVVDMVSGNPDWEPPTALREALHEYADADADDFQYPPSVGLTELREEIAQRRGVARERVVITNGTGEANHLAMTGGYESMPGEEIVLTDPVYPYYAGRSNLIGASRRFVPADADGQLQPERAKEAVSDETSVVVVNSPNNPTGAVYPEATIATLVDLVEDHDAVLVSDEVYDHFDHSGRFTSALSFDSDHVVVTNGFSKSMAITGFRVGYGVFPDPEAAGPLGDILDGARTRHMLTNVTGARPSQKAVYEALRETPPEYYEANRELLDERIADFTAALDGAGAEYTSPQGAFYVMARFEDFPGTFENVEKLIDEAGVAGMPGEAFGQSKADWIRFAMVTPRADVAAERLAEYFA
ncbi:pyridoxal phosphate-dependent aminotransferase [Haloarculaceae archaeon H-GB2-1]|nr:pyridoxal phosphate-dependent aminotransferase [Haloarculaceae archaeon H-GB1-1]MEA5386289.1 pyridoxal phosphate-dependent aminotransferase [Haloarculaceae archaeon H-GB11]MEA5407793.1 pyridoxal phosphate-dependent aminotransferase [Haloarculaceae archaeon H-GB2-1]